MKLLRPGVRGVPIRRSSGHCARDIRPGSVSTSLIPWFVSVGGKGADVTAVVATLVALACFLELQARVGNLQLQKVPRVVQDHRQVDSESPIRKPERLAPPRCRAARTSPVSHWLVPQFERFREPERPASETVIGEREAEREQRAPGDDSAKIPPSVDELQQRTPQGGADGTDRAYRHGPRPIHPDASRIRGQECDECCNVDPLPKPAVRRAEFGESILDLHLGAFSEGEVTVVTAEKFQRKMVDAAVLQRNHAVELGAGVEARTDKRDVAQPASLNRQPLKEHGSKVLPEKLPGSRLSTRQPFNELGCMPKAKRRRATSKPPTESPATAAPSEGTSHEKGQASHD